MDESITGKGTHAHTQINALFNCDNDEFDCVRVWNKRTHRSTKKRVAVWVGVQVVDGGNEQTNVPIDRSVQH